jgi:hypothetical protein
VGWTNVWTRLHRYATATLRLAAIGAERADVVEAGDLVNTLVEKGLDGSLSWTLPEHASNEEIIGYACAKLHGMRSNLRRDASRAVYDDAIDERPDEGPDALALLSERRRIATVIEAFAHDVEASSVIRMMLGGMKRAEIMMELRISAEHADVVRKRIARGIAALDAGMDKDDGDEPPSSGPRGRHHDPQATEERQGAPPEPHRGAGGAGRRR